MVLPSEMVPPVKQMSLGEKDSFFMSLTRVRIRVASGGCCDKVAKDVLIKWQTMFRFIYSLEEKS